MKGALWATFMVAVVFSGGPPIMLGAMVAGFVVWAVFWL